MAIALVQSAINAVQSTTCTATLGATPTAGNLLLLCTGVRSPNNPSTKSNGPWTSISNFAHSGAPDKAHIIFDWKVASGSETVSMTVTFGNSYAFNVACAEFSGVDTTAIDQDTQGEGQSTTEAFTSITPASDALLLFGFAVSETTGTYSAPTDSHTLEAQASQKNSGAIIYRILTSGGTPHAPAVTHTQAKKYLTAYSSWTEAAAGSSAPQRRRMG